MILHMKCCWRSDQELLEGYPPVLVCVGVLEHLLDLGVGDQLGQVPHDQEELRPAQEVVTQPVLLSSPVDTG